MDEMYIIHNYTFSLHVAVDSAENATSRCLRIFIFASLLFVSVACKFLLFIGRESVIMLASLDRASSLPLLSEELLVLL